MVSPWVQRLTRLVRLQLVACPLPIFHAEEGLVWRSYEILRAVRRSLSAELQFHDYTAIRNGQLYEHAQLWAQGGSEAPELDVDRVLEGDRNGWQPRLLIDARLPITDDFIVELNGAREAEDEGWADVWSRWCEEDATFDAWFREEALSYEPSRAALGRRKSSGDVGSANRPGIFDSSMTKLRSLS